MASIAAIYLNISEISLSISKNLSITMGTITCAMQRVPSIPILLLLAVLVWHGCNSQVPPKPFQVLATTDTTFEEPQYITSKQLANAKQPWDMSLALNDQLVAILTQVGSDASGNSQLSAQLHILNLSDVSNITRVGGSDLLGTEAARVLVVNDVALVPLLDKANPALFVCHLDLSTGCASTATIPLASIPLDLVAFPFDGDQETVALAYSDATGTGVLAALDTTNHQISHKTDSDSRFNLLLKPVRLAVIDQSSLAVIASNGSLYIMDYDIDSDSFANHTDNNFITGNPNARLAVVESSSSIKHVAVAHPNTEGLIIITKGTSGYTSSTYSITGGRPQSMLATGSTLLLGHRNLGQVNLLDFDDDGIISNISISTTRNTTRLARGNFTGSGASDKDLVVVEGIRRALGIIKNTGDSYTRSVIGTSFYMRKLLTADLNGNGKSDILVLQPHNNGLAIFQSR